MDKNRNLKINYITSCIFTADFDFVFQTDQSLGSNILHDAGSSSVPSPQSSVPSQIHLLVMHLPLPHVNWLELHVRAPSVKDKELQSSVWHEDDLLMTFTSRFTREHHAVTSAVILVKLMFNWQLHRNSLLKVTEVQIKCGKKKLLLFA